MLDFIRVNADIDDFERFAAACHVYAVTEFGALSP
jgi:hypothetical protein